MSVGSKRNGNGNTSRARPLRFTSSTRRKVGRPSSLTMERRARVVRAVLALRANCHKVVAAELGVSPETYRNWVAEVKRELIAKEMAKRGRP